MKRYFILMGALFFLFVFAQQANAQDFVYQPTNPSFGGNYYNGSWLLSKANAQNKLSGKSSSYSSYYDRDPLKEFQQSLNRQILNELSRNITSSVFGEGSFTEEGRYELGNYIINVEPGSQGIMIDIKDLSTGSEANIEVPYY